LLSHLRKFCEAIMVAPENRQGSDLLILGLGNPLMGDDGLGGEVVRRLSQRERPIGVRIEEAGTPGLALLDLWDGWSRVWLVDAVEMGLAPGAWRCFEPLPVARLDEVCLSAHGGSLESVLCLARELDPLPLELLLFAVQPERVSAGVGLSDVVAAAAETLREEIQQRLGIQSGS